MELKSLLAVEDRASPLVIDIEEASSAISAELLSLVDNQNVSVACGKTIHATIEDGLRKIQGLHDRVEALSEELSGKIQKAVAAKTSADTSSSHMLWLASVGCALTGASFLAALPKWAVYCCAGTTILAMSMSAVQHYSSSQLIEAYDKLKKQQLIVIKARSQLTSLVEHFSRKVAFHATEARNKKLEERLREMEAEINALKTNRQSV